MNTFLAVLFATVLASPAPATAPANDQKTFDSAKEAADALVQAVSSDDTATMLAIFGSDGKKIVASGDEVKDKNDRERFEALAKTKTDVVVDKKDPHRAKLLIGADGWPFPVPIVEAGNKWHFATKEGLREILYRRIGQNELDAMQVCHGYVEAQQEYSTVIHDNSGVNQYAQRILSTAGKQDGLAWFDADGKPAGPIGAEVAKALEEGYSKRTEPFHGYFFKILKAQGPAAPKGKLDYVIQGAMIGGFALVAWPADYRATGVMTFIINHDGILYEKNLGPDTAKIASAMTEYNPDKTWTKVPEDAAD
jgi:hypothetical protein